MTGYSGAELARILHRHPRVDITSVTGRSGAGKKIGEVFPHLSDIDIAITEDIDRSVDFVFSALPHAASATRLVPYIDKGIKVVDISADFRLKNPAEYSDWYKVDHPCPELLDEAVYGLTELNIKDIKSSTLVANPGCYPTVAILSLAPAIKAGLVESDLIVDAKSGVSGSGRALSLTNHFSEITENVMAYGLSGHRHLPEIIQELEGFKIGGSLRVTFVPHLVPMVRGILASCYARLKESISTREIQAIYTDFYSDNPFVRIVDTPPMTKHTLGSNDCIIHPVVDNRTGLLTIIGCIDNLVKGAAGQAVQNMNVMCGFSEEEGLGQLALYP